MKTPLHSSLRRLALAFVILHSAFGIPSAARAGDVVTNLANTVNNSDLLFAANVASAHAFTTGPLPVKLTSVTVRLSDTGSASAARVQVWSGGGSVPSTLVEDLGTVQVIANGGASTDYTIASATRPTLDGGTRYWVSVTSLSGSLNWKVTDNTAATGSGTLLANRASSSNGGTTWSVASGASRHQFAVVGSQLRTVTSTANSGAFSLRQTIADSDPGDIIGFASGLNGFTITLSSEIALNKSLTIDASALSLGLTISGNNASRIFFVTGGATVALHGLTLSSGNGVGASPSGSGGAVHNFDSTLTLTRCTLSGNSTTEGGAIYSFTDSITGPITSSTTLTHCTLSGNSASQSGGAIHNENGRTTLTRCTVSGNTATLGAGFGSGVASFGDSATETVVQGTIIAGNTNSSVDFFIEGINSFTSLGSNLIGSGNATGDFNQPGDIINNNAPLLAALGNYGGSVKTRPPLSGSPAVNAALGFPGGTDQRGLAIGSYVYENDFALPSLKGAVVTAFGGNPATGTVDAGSFRFTPAAQNQSATLVLPDPGAFSTFAASFDLSYSSAGGSGFGDPADGMSFSFGPAPAGAVGEDGVAGAHRISVNIFNGNHPANALLRYINPAGTIVQQVTFPRFDDADAFRAFTVTLDATGRLRVTYKGALVLNVANIGALTGQRFTFAARTGGAFSEQRVDNIGIVTNPAGGAPDIGAVERDSAIPGFTPVVTSAMDTADGLNVNGVSLREAAAFAPAGSTITFAAGVNGGTITLGGSHIVLDKNVTIDATALAAGITISGNANANGTLDAGESRLFEIPGGITAVLRRLRMVNGQVSVATGTFGDAASGGAILNKGHLTLEQCLVAGSRARSGGGIFNNSGATLIVTASTLSGNSATDQGGGGIANVGGSVTLTQSTLSGNTSGNFGGGIDNSSIGTLSLTHCTVTGNSASLSGGGISHASTTLALTHCIVAGNSAPDGEDIINFGGTVTRTGANIVQVLVNDSGGTDTGPAAINLPPQLAPLGDYGGPTPTMPAQPSSPAIDPVGGATSSAFATDQRGAPRVVDGDNSGGAGGAIADIGAVEFVPAIVTNTDNSGGGSLRATIALPFASAVTFAPGVNGGTITLTTGQITLTKNLTIDATALAGGITVSGNNASRIFNILGSGGSPAIALHGLTLTGGNSLSGGGAIQNFGGSLTLTRCTLHGNMTSGFGGAIVSGSPGASLALTHCTLAGNTAVNGGGAIDASATLTLRHCTVSGNTATNGDGGGVVFFTGTFTLENSIVAGNAAGSTIGADIRNLGTLTRVGANLVQALSGSATGPGTISTAAPLLAPLGDYGGPTRTLPPLPGSPAIDTAVGSTETLDQRGLARPQGAARDIGAVEVFAGAAFLDADMDGMDDRLEPLWGFIVGVQDGALDGDGDGSSNSAELGNMTSPRDPNSSLRILAFTPAGVSLDGDPRFDVTWTSFPGLSYTLQAKADLNFGVTPREADPVTATGFTETLRIELDKLNPKDFVRVRRD